MPTINLINISNISTYTKKKKGSATTPLGNFLNLYPFYFASFNSLVQRHKKLLFLPELSLYIINVAVLKVPNKFKH